MATYSNNATISISTAISNDVASGAAYSAPANRYAILNVVVIFGSGSFNVQVGGRQIHPNSTANITLSGVYVGPGQSISLNVITGSAQIYVTGVEFKNTP